MTEITASYLTEIRGRMREILKPSRYEHTLGVAYTAACMGMVHGVDPLRCELAGLLHDCAKNMTDEELLEACTEAGILLSDEEKALPQILHSIYGAYLAWEKYGISDAELRSAIRWHTTGKEEMSMLEKIIYIADFIEPLRDKASCLPEARKLAFTDPDACMYVILKNTVEYLEQSFVPVEKHTLKAYQYYKAIVSNKRGE